MIRDDWDYFVQDVATSWIWTCWSGWQGMVDRITGLDWKYLITDSNERLLNANTVYLISQQEKTAFYWNLFILQSYLQACLILAEPIKF